MYEGLDGGYTFDGRALRDADGDPVLWRPTEQPEPAAAVKVEPCNRPRCGGIGLLLLARRSGALALV